MDKWAIAKEFGFDYGHRVWSQKLNPEYSLNQQCICRHKHGHRGKVKVFLESIDLNEQGMVIDFHYLAWFGKFLDDVIDHKYLFDISDPLLKHDFRELYDKFGILSEWTVEKNIEGFSYRIVNPDIYKNLEDYMQEHYESFIFVDFIPTSENICKWFFDITSYKMSKINIKVSRVQFFETPKSQSNYYSD